MMGFEETSAIRDPLDFEVGLGLRGGSDAGSAAAAAANAASEREIAELRRQFNKTQANIKPFLDAGASQLPALMEGATAEGLDARLRKIFASDTFGDLVDERTRAIQGQLSAGGLTRSGTGLAEAAAIPTDLGLAIENLLNDRSTQLAGSGQNAAVGLGALGSQTSFGIANSLGRQGQNTASGILADSQAQAQQKQNLLGTAATAAGIFFSDPRLKENVEQISEIADLGVYQWDWKEETKGLGVDSWGNIGFMADEVKEKYPQHVGEYCGLMTIDYESLLDELETKACQH